LEEGDLLVDCQRHSFARLAGLPIIVRTRRSDDRAIRSGIQTLPAAPTSTGPMHELAGDFPTLLHVTHWKAGSQWIYAILRALFADRIVPPQVGDYQVRHWPIQPGRVYPTVYSTRDELERQPMPTTTLKFVALRDLRDTLISWYFSFKHSHRVMTTRMAKYRDLLNELSLEDGLIAMIEYQLYLAAQIQSSWAVGPEPIVKYEDLLEDDVGVLKRLFIDRFSLPVPVEVLQTAVESCRFEHLSGGRRAGDADLASHYRKGIAGDWRNYFTPRVADAFKARFGNVLVATGYERDLDW
jgi:lipopolysaccharide transport system ATP-binding protein